MEQLNNTFREEYKEKKEEAPKPNGGNQNKGNQKSISVN